MKTKIFILTTLLFSVSYAAQAQYTYKPFRIDVGTGLSFPVTNFGIGILGSIEPQYAIDQFAIGVRIELHALGQMSEEYTSLTKYNSATLLTCDYHFSSDTYRPFVGVGIGAYTLAANIYVNSSTYTAPSYNDYTDGELIYNDYISTYNVYNYDRRLFFGQNVGAMLRAGFDLPHLRCAVQYNIVGSGKKDDVKMNFNYLSINVAVGIGGGKVAKVTQ
jgi:hypothetical protein